MAGNQIISQKIPTALAILKMGNLSKIGILKETSLTPSGVRIKVSRYHMCIYLFVTFYLFIYLLLIIHNTYVLQWHLSEQPYHRNMLWLGASLQSVVQMELWANTYSEKKTNRNKLSFHCFQSQVCFKWIIFVNETKNKVTE